MKLKPLTKKGAWRWLVDAKTTVIIDRNLNRSGEMTKNKKNDQPKIPPLQGAGICWSWKSVGNFNQGAVR